MSLIQEALKRKEQEEAGSVPPTRTEETHVEPAKAEPAEPVQAASAKTENAEPALMTSMPVVEPPDSQKSGLRVIKPVTPEQDDMKHEPGHLQNIPPQSMPIAHQLVEVQAYKPAEKKQLSVIWWVIGAICALAVSGIFVMFSLNSALAKKKAARQARLNAIAAKAATGQVNIASSTGAATAKQAAAGASSTSAAAEAGAVSIPAATQITATEQSVETDALHQASPETKEEKKAFMKAKPAVVQKVSVKWPVLKLSGILRGTGQQESTAYINGRMMTAGQTIEGVTVTEIQPDQVILKYESETKALRVGATLY
jgi:flagellar basal body-associated protein FliL